MPFIDRTGAGKQLGDRLTRTPYVDPVVLALPRGGVPVGYQVARAIGAPLDVIVVRKLGIPFQPELAMGAIGEDGVRVIDEDVVSSAGLSEQEIRSVETHERAELSRRIQQVRSATSRVPLAGRTAIVVDDGMATGSTARAGCLVARAHGATRVVVAVPVASREAMSQLRRVADEVIALETPEPFYAVGQWYLDFDHTSDQQMVELLVESRRHWDRSLAEVAGRDRLDPVDPVDPPMRDQEVAVCPSLGLTGYLTVPEGARAMVVFVHGSGSSRHSPRNRFVARVLNQARLATLLFDLLTPQEEIERSHVFDIALLGGRLLDVTRWLQGEPDAKGLAIGYFGASTGSAAALWSAAKEGFDIGAVVSRGGRPDLAASCLPAVTAPTLLIVGERDEAVLDFNRQAQSELTCENRLAIVPRAAHLFEEPGTLQVAADLATNWFIAHLTSV